MFTVGDSARGRAAHRRLVPTPNRTVLDPSLLTFPNLLQAAGYQTIHVGKWHIGDDPAEHGFEVNLAACHWGHPNRGYFSPYGIPGFEDGPDGEYLTARLDLSDQSPLRGEKGSYYEGGIRVPLAIRWPGVIRPGSRDATPVTGLDLYPTFLEIAGLAVPEGHPTDGDSLVPLLRGTAGLPPDRELVWHFPIYLQAYGRGNPTTRDPLFRTRPGSVIRADPWKLHEYFEDGALEPYHLNSDPGERRDVSSLFPERAAGLHQRLRAWRQRLDAPVPTKSNPRFDPEAEAAAMRDRILSVR